MAESNDPKFVLDNNDPKPTIQDGLAEIEHAWQIPPAMPAGASPDAVGEAGQGLWAKVKETFKGIKTLAVAAFFLAMSGLAYFDPDTLPLDSILGMFLPESKVAGAVGGVTIAFTLLRLVSPGLLAGLASSSSKKE